MAVVKLSVENCLNIVFVAGSLVVGVRVVGKESSSVGLPEHVGSGGPATTAAVVASVARDELLLGHLVEDTGLDGFVRLYAGGSHEGPATAAAALVLDSVDDSPIAPVNVDLGLGVRGNQPQTVVRRIKAAELFLAQWANRVDTSWWLSAWLRARDTKDDVGSLVSTSYALTSFIAALTTVSPASNALVSDDIVVLTSGALLVINALVASVVHPMIATANVVENFVAFVFAGRAIAREVLARSAVLAALTATIVRLELVVGAVCVILAVVTGIEFSSGALTIIVFGVLI